MADISANSIISKLNARLSEATLQNIILEIRIEGMEEQIRALKQFAQEDEN